MHADEILSTHLEDEEEIRCAVHAMQGASEFDGGIARRPASGEADGSYRVVEGDLVRRVEPEIAGRAR